MEPQPDIDPTPRPPGLPLWLKATLVGVLAAAVVLVVVLVLTGQDLGQHGPGRHGG